MPEYARVCRCLCVPHPAVPILQAKKGTTTPSYTQSGLGVGGGLLGLEVAYWDCVGGGLLVKVLDCRLKSPVPVPLAAEIHFSPGALGPTPKIEWKVYLRVFRRGHYARGVSSLSGSSPSTNQTMHALFPDQLVHPHMYKTFLKITKCTHTSYIKQSLNESPIKLQVYNACEPEMLHSN